MTPAHLAMFNDFKHDFFRACVLCTGCSVLANFLPASSKLDRCPKWKLVYEAFVDLVAGFGGNWRADLPSLALEFMGFRRRVRHGIRGWQQDKLDERMKREARKAKPPC